MLQNLSEISVLFVVFFVAVLPLTVLYCLWSVGADHVLVALLVLLK